MEIENKLDEDFLFYLGFISSYFHNLKDKTDIDKCQVSIAKIYNDLFILAKILGMVGKVVR